MFWHGNQVSKVLWKMLDHPNAWLEFKVGFEQSQIFEDYRFVCKCMGFYLPRIASTP